MGMPIITPGTGTRDQAIADLIESVALQETALAHILNAEGEKMQAIINTPGITTDQLTDLNDSVNKLVNGVIRLEMTLQSKLELFADEIPAITSTAADQLAKINVSDININVPLSDPAAWDAAIAAATAKAQAQVDPGYTVTFTTSGYDAVNGTLSGKYTVTNGSNPLDTATDAAARTINVISDATTAADQLAKINVTDININVPLSDPAARDAAIAEAVAKAQAQVDPGYTVTFTTSGYDAVYGTLSGKYTVTNGSNPLDAATDAAARTINVISDATTAADQLAKINVSDININVPLSDPTAWDTAIAAATAKAQAQVDPGYTVTFTTSGYDAVNGILSGKYTVTNGSNPLDTAADSADRAINVTAPPLSIRAESNSSAQFLSGSLLGIDLSGFSDFDGVTAHYENGVNEPGAPDSKNAGLSLDALNSTPLNGVISLGVVSQSAQASENGVSTASSGTTSVGVNLIELIPPNPLISQANLDVGAISGTASLDAGPSGAVTRDYNIDGAALNLQSPVIETAVESVNLAASTASQAVSGLSSALLNGLLGGVTNILGTLGGLVPGLNILDNTLQINISLVDLSTELAPLLSEPVVSGDGALTLNLSAGTLNVDLSKLTGLNGLPPNTDLLSSTSISGLVNDLAEIVQAVTTKLQNLVMSILTDTTTLDISGGINLLTDPIFGTTLAGVNINYNGSLADLLTGETQLAITGAGTLAPFDAVIGPLNSIVQTVAANALNPLINDPETGVWAVVTGALATALNGLSSSLSPIFQSLADVISIAVNVQSQNGPVYSENPLELNVLNEGGALDLAKVTVGENAYLAQ